MVYLMRMFQMMTQRLFSGRLSPSDRYLLAKQITLDLHSSLHLYTSDQVHYAAVIREAIQLVQVCSSAQQGEIYLLCSQALVQLDPQALSRLLPSSFPSSVQAYLLSLLDPQPVRQTSRETLRDAYTGKLKKNSQAPQPRRKLLDCLLIDRIDRVLRGIAENGFCFGGRLKDGLAKSLRLAEAILLGGELEKFRENIEFVVKSENVGVKEEGEQKEREKGGRGEVGRFIIIDQSLSTHRQAKLAVRNSSSSKILMMNGRNRKDSTSIMESSDFSRKLQQKQSLLHRSSKRGSISSSYSKRSSTFRSEQKTNKRLSSRWGIKLNAEMVSSNFSKGKPFRRSNFLQVKLKESELPDEELPFAKISSIIEEEGHPQKQAEMTIHSFVVDGFMKSLRRMKSFFIFLHREQRITLAMVEELKDLDFSPLEQNLQDEFRIKIKAIDRSDSILFLSFPQLQLGSHSKEATCLGVLRLGVQFYQDELGIIRTRRRKRQSEFAILEGIQEPSMEERNVFRMEETEQGVLMGFVRKISTYFLCICKYSKAQLGVHYQLGVRRRMLEEGQKLKAPVMIQKQLKNTDLTISFSNDAPSPLKSGSAINYIQKQEESQDLAVEDGFRTKIVPSTAKEIGEGTMRVIWYSQAYQQMMEKEEKRRYRKGASRIQKHTDEGRRIKRVGIKNSIKIPNLTDLHAMAFEEADLFRSHQQRTMSRQDLTQEGRDRPKPATKRKKTGERKKHFIESVRTDKGYQLVLHQQKQLIEGCAYESYFGYKERNPKRCCYHKDALQSQQKDKLEQRQDYLRPSLSIHGRGGRTIDSRLLISFTKIVHCQEGFGGYAVSSIKILPHCANNQVLIQTYWQARQKHFVFIVSADQFQRLTDINTLQFDQRPFLQSEPQITKKRDKRTSVVASLMREREADQLRQSGSRLRRVPRLRDDSLREIEEQSLVRRKGEGRTATTHQVTLGRVFKTVDTMKSSSLQGQRPAVRREVVLRLRSKIVKYASLAWRKGTLYLQLRYNVPTQLEPVGLVEFQGLEVALKNVHSHPMHPSQLQATELILLKYAEPSLANLSFYPIQAAPQIHLRHVFIKNTLNLHGRYIATVSLRDLIDNHRFSLEYLKTNCFFEPKEQASWKHPYSKILTKNSTIEEQRKIKYQQIISLARTCCISFSQLTLKKTYMLRRCFTVPNRYSIFPQEHLLLQVRMSEQEVTVSSMHGDVLVVISMRKLIESFALVKDLSMRTFSRLITSRILKDADILRLCEEDKQEKKGRGFLKRKGK